MNLLGLEIKRKSTPDPHPFGKVIFNIQIRENGVTLAGPDGKSIPTIGIDVNPRAWLLGFAHAEQFGVDWTTVSKITEMEVSRWAELGTQYRASEIVAPTAKALDEILKARENKNPNEMFG